MKKDAAPPPTPQREALPMQAEVKIHSLHTGGDLLADASITLNGCFAVRGVRVMNGSNGPFVSMPSYKAQGGYKDVCFPCTKKFQQALTQIPQRRQAQGQYSFLWFLCAVAFLKVSQKIDSFMATLEVNVGRTGGSMLAEAMIAMRTVTMVMGGGHGGDAGRTGSAAGSSAGRAGAAGMAGFFKGGLVGMASRHVTSSAVKSAVTNTSSLHTAQSQVQQAAAVQTTTESNVNSAVHTGGDTAIYAPQAGNAAGGTEGGVHHTEHSSQAAHAVHTVSSSAVVLL